MKTTYLFLSLFVMVFYACSTNESSKDFNPEPRLIVRLSFDTNQERLDNLGRPSRVSNGNASQSPHITKMSAHYIEFATNANTLFGEGEVIYQGAETNLGGEKAIDFQEVFFAGDDEVLLNLPLSSLHPGSYEWVRVSLAYQEGDIQILYNGQNFTGRLASFVGYNTYITNLEIKGRSVTINSNKPQGFWAFETDGIISQGQAQGVITVPNPLFLSSPIPQGSCVVTGQFDKPFVITGHETKDLTVNLSFSVNNSFEWNEVNNDGKYEPAAGEKVIDMGLRGLKPLWIESSNF